MLANTDGSGLKSNLLMSPQLAVSQLLLGMDQVWTRRSLHSSEDRSWSDELKDGFETGALAGS